MMVYLVLGMCFAALMGFVFWMSCMKIKGRSGRDDDVYRLLEA